MFSIFPYFPSKSYRFRLGGFRKKLSTELAILEWFLTWCFKHARIPVRAYFQRNCWWLNLVTYIRKFVDFVLPIWVTYVVHLPKTNSLFFPRKQQGRIILNLTFWKKMLYNLPKI